MLIIPAIDLYQGKVIRLTKGDISQSKVYSEDPLGMARYWQDQGAKLLHVVDLSAALGEDDNIRIIEDILKNVKVKIEVGGGIRDIEKAKRLVSLGVERIIIGTKGLDEDFLNKLTEELAIQKIAVGVDVINSRLAVEGWKKKTDLRELDFIAYLKLKGIKWIVYTDISRDGTLEGPNYEALKKLSAFRDMNIVFSGGVSSLEDIKNFKKNTPFLKGIIIGKALYEKRIELKEALTIFEKH